MALIHRATTTSAASPQATFSDFDSADGPSCPLPNKVQSLAVRGSIYNPMLYTAYACMGFICVSQLAQVIVYLYHYRRPAEQRQVIRILFAPIVLSLVAWAEIYSYSNANFISPIAAFYEAFALCCLFLLIKEYTGDTANTSTRSRVSWMFVFQFPVLEVIAIIILEATSARGVFCRQSLQPKFGHLWYALISSIGVSGCLTSIWRYFKAHRAQVRARKPLGKLFCFKGIVFFSFLQDWIISGLLQDGHLTENSQWAYGDYVYGLPNFLFLIELVIYSVLFWFAYPISDYYGDKMPMAWYKAVLDVFDFRDFLHGFKMMIVVAFMGRAAFKNPSNAGHVETKHVHEGHVIAEPKV